MLGVGRAHQRNHRPRLLDQPGEGELAQRHPIGLREGLELRHDARLALALPVVVWQGARAGEHGLVQRAPGQDGHVVFQTG